jgi:hypothetical protein
MSRVTIEITSENDDFSFSLDEIKRHLEWGNKWGMDGSDTDSYVYQRTYL